LRLPSTDPRVKFQPDQLAGVNTIARQDSQGLWVGASVFRASVLVPWRGNALDWPVGRFEDLNSTHFEAVLKLGPELVIFGSGARIRFPAPGLYAALIARRIGVEAMDTAAACRTFNVLATEGRSVVAALLQEAQGQ
jgi:uncharacterized protein